MHIIPSVAWDSYSTALDRMLILTMAPPRPKQPPTIAFDEPDQVADLHGKRLELQAILLGFDLCWV